MTEKYEVDQSHHVIPPKYEKRKTRIKNIDNPSKKSSYRHKALRQEKKTNEA